MKLLSLQLKNYRCFDSFNIRFDESVSADGSERPINLHVILAPNMIGKSAVLKALRIGIGTSLVKIDANPGNAYVVNITPEEHRVIGNNPFSDKARNVEITIEAKSTTWQTKDNVWKEHKYIWKKYKEDLTRKHSKFQAIQGNIVVDTNESFNKVIEQETGVIPLLLYVGTEYIHQAQPETATLDLNGSAKQGYWYCLDDKSMETYVFTWFKKLYKTLLEQLRNPVANELYGKIATATLNTFKSALMLVLPDILDVAWVENTVKSTPDYFLAFRIKDQGIRTYDMLSDGYKYLVLLVGEMVTRATLLNKHLGESVLSQITGVILIDEFGIHLHPTLQSDTLTRLSQTFPAVQFIVTTHSPLLVNGLYKEQIHIISEDSEGKRSVHHPAEDAIGLGAEGILREMFGLSTTFDNTTLDYSEDYKRLLDKKMTGALSPEEEEEFKQLGSKLSTARLDPALQIVNDDPIAHLVRERMRKETEKHDDRIAFTQQDATSLEEKVNSILDEILKQH